MKRCGTGSPIPSDTYYLLGSAIGPHPYPYLVRELQSVIGREARAQMLAEAGALPDVLIACVGGGSNAIGIFHPFVADASVEIIGIEAGGRGKGLGENSATLSAGRPGVLHGCYSMLLQDEHGQMQETHSVSAGLDYPGVGPEHALLLAHRPRALRIRRSTTKRSPRVRECCESEGILPAIESAHALAGAKRWAQKHPGKRILVGLSGRGDKDMPTLQRTLLAETGDEAARSHQRLDPLGRAARRARARRVSHRRLSASASVFASTCRRSPPARTSSRSACRSPIRWRTASPFSARATKRSCRA